MLSETLINRVFYKSLTKTGIIINAEVKLRCLHENIHQRFGDIFMINEIVDEQSLFNDLTEREIDVLWCVIQGIRNKEISKELYISPSTVKFHLSSLYKKTNTKGRTQLTNKVLLSLISKPLNFELFIKSLKHEEVL